jgi:hypothetical protein
MIDILVTITIQDIIHCPVFYLKHDVSETDFCLHIQVEPTQLVPVDRASLSHLKMQTESSLRIVVF